MKQLKIIAILLLLISQLSSVDFAKKYSYYTDYNEAIKIAKELKRNIVMVLVSDYCPWCDKLKDEVLSLEYTNDILHKNYIPLMLNNIHDQYPSRFDSYVAPTIHFVSYKDETIIETILGFNNYWRFYEIIEVYKQATKNQK
jgi:thioredoxin-related protein